MRKASLLLIERLEAWRSQLARAEADAARLGLNQRQAEGVAPARLRRSISRRDYVDLTGAGAATASRDLVDLARRGLLRAAGNTRNRRYRPTPPASQQG